MEVKIKSVTETKINIELSINESKELVTALSCVNESINYKYTEKGFFIAEIIEKLKEVPNN